VACGLCEKICPSLCIIVVPETGPGGIRALAGYTLDLNRCSFCGLCVEACPVEAIAMSAEYELAAWGREPLVCNTERLLAAPARNGGERP
jgi:NADH-quinone oxidoreductase subunit I